MHVYSHILTFTKLSTYSASIIKSNFDNFVGINTFYNNPFIPPWVRPCRSRPVNTDVVLDALEDGPSRRVVCTEHSCGRAII